MKAIVARQLGTPDVLELKYVPKPRVDNEQANPREIQRRKTEMVERAVAMVPILRERAVASRRISFGA